MSKKIYRLCKHPLVLNDEHSESLKREINTSPNIMEAVHDLIKSKIDLLDKKLDDEGVANTTPSAMRVCSLTSARKELKELLKQFEITEE